MNPPYLRYPLSRRDVESLFEERGFDVDHSTINRRVLAYAPEIEKRLRQFRRLHCGSIRVDETYVKVRGASVYPKAISDRAQEGLTPGDVQHRVSKHLQQGIESDHFHVKKNMPKVGGFRTFATAKRTIAGFEAMLWLKKGFGFAGEWTVRRQNELLALCFGLQEVNNP